MRCVKLLFVAPLALLSACNAARGPSPGVGFDPVAGELHQGARQGRHRRTGLSARWLRAIECALRRRRNCEADTGHDLCADPHQEFLRLGEIPAGRVDSEGRAGHAIRLADPHDDDGVERTIHLRECRPRTLLSHHPAHLEAEGCARA